MAVFLCTFFRGWALSYQEESEKALSITYYKLVISYCRVAAFAFGAAFHRIAK